LKYQDLYLIFAEHVTHNFQRLHHLIAMHRYATSMALDAYFAKDGIQPVANAVIAVSEYWLLLHGLLALPKATDDSS
jgi:hypothetical protein